MTNLKILFHFIIIIIKYCETKILINEARTAGADTGFMVNYGNIF